MARDYKHARRGGRRDAGFPGWAWLLTGLAIGLFVAFGVYLKGHVPPEDGPVRLPDLDAGSDAREDTTSGESGDSQTSQQPPEPRFDFYTILPDREVVVPESELDDDVGERAFAPEEAPEPAPPGTRFVLQAGSFKHYEQADQLKATLALVGIDADIHTVTLDTGETWHRVRIGPYEDRVQMRSIRGRLLEHDIEAILLKVKEDS